MKISEIHKQKKSVLSFEIFPPKKDEELKNIDKTLEILCVCVCVCVSLCVCAYMHTGVFAGM